MNIPEISNEDFSRLQQKLCEAGYLKQGYVGQGADWRFDFSNGKEMALLGLKRFLNDIGPDRLSTSDLILLAFMLDNTNSDGECVGD